MTIYCVDVDHTLEVSMGPVKLQQLVNLKRKGNIIALAGNWAIFIARVQGWENLISLANIAVDKATFLSQIKMYIKADRYVMVGNDGDGITVSADKQAAQVAGWEFIEEKFFTEGLEDVAQTTKQEVS